MDYLNGLSLVCSSLICFNNIFTFKICPVFSVCSDSDIEVVFEPRQKSSQSSTLTTNKCVV